MITFYEIQKRIANKFDFKVDDTTTKGVEILDLIKYYTNEAHEIVYNIKPKCIKKQDVLALQASYSTGTITTVDGSAAVTGLGTTFTRDMVGQKIVITDDEDGTVVYRIKSYTSATSITLDTKYIHTGGAAQTYAIYYDTYNFPPDFRILEVMQDVDPIDTYFNDDNYFRSSSYTSGIPVEIKLLGVKTDSYYSTGTVAITNALSAVVGADTVFDEYMVGRYIQLGNYGKLYEITAVADTTHLTIGKGYGGSTLTTGKYQIDPPSIQQGRFPTAPSAATIVPYTYWPRATRLQDDNDVSPLPSDSVLVSGGAWLFAKYKSAKVPGLSAIATAEKRDFNEEAGRLSTVESNVNQKGFTPRP